MKHETVDRGQLRNIYAVLHGAKQQAAEFDELVSSKPEKFNESMKLVPPWGAAYEKPWKNILSALFKVVGLSEKITELAEQDNPANAILKLVDDDPKLDVDPGRDVSDDQKWIGLALFFAFLGNLESVNMYGVPLSQLVEKASEGDDEALFNAVTVDRAAMQAEPIARRICKAQIANDTSFMDRLAKAVTRTRPRRPSEKLDDVRYMLIILHEQSRSVRSSVRKDHYALFSRRTLAVD